MPGERGIIYFITGCLCSICRFVSSFYFSLRNGISIYFGIAKGEINMLNIFLGDMKDVIFNTSVYFKNVYHDEWITAPLSF